MPYASETELTLRQILTDSQFVQNSVHSFITGTDISDLEDALYHAENVKLLLERVINNQMRTKRTNNA